MRPDHQKRTATAKVRRRPAPTWDHTSPYHFDEVINAAQQRLAVLQKQAVRAPEEREPILSEVFQDLQITLEELQVADEELRQQNEELAMARQIAEVERQRYQELFDFAPDAYLVTDTAVIVQAANHAAAALLAVAQHRLRGKPLIVFVDPAEQRAFYDHLAHLSQCGGVSTWEMRLRPRQGDPLYVAVTAGIVRDAQGHSVTLRWLLRDISERKAAQQETKQAEQAVQQSREQLRALTMHLQNQQEEERLHIAREIHDELAQTLTVLKIDVAWLSHRLAASDASCHLRLCEMATMLDTLVNAVRRIGTELRPHILDDLGLTAAIEWQLQEVCKRTGMAHQLELPAEEIPLGQAQTTAIFRIFQEALTNVLRHAAANKVSVRLVQQPDALILQVVDNGRGITPEQLAARHSLGLLSMRERAHLWGGEVTIEGKPGQGTIVSVRMPNTAQALGVPS
ncbi:MAG: ATP-binding protein [Candidatus Entotheonellia bacterium]